MGTLYNTSERFASSHNRRFLFFRKRILSVVVYKTRDLAAQTAHQNPVANPIQHTVALLSVFGFSIQKVLSVKTERNERLQSVCVYDILHKTEVFV